LNGPDRQTLGGCSFPDQVCQRRHWESTTGITQQLPVGVNSGELFQLNFSSLEAGSDAAFHLQFILERSDLSLWLDPFAPGVLDYPIDADYRK
jgi:hypothetical protein